MAPHSSTLAWKIPWLEEPGRLQSMGSYIHPYITIFYAMGLHRVGHDRSDLAAAAAAAAAVFHCGLPCSSAVKNPPASAGDAGLIPGLGRSPGPMDCSPPGSSIHGIFQVRVLEWGAIKTKQLVLFASNYTAAAKRSLPYMSTVTQTLSLALGCVCRRCI